MLWAWMLCSLYSLKGERNYAYALGMDALVIVLIKNYERHHGWGMDALAIAFMKT